MEGKMNTSQLLAFQEQLYDENQIKLIPVPEKPNQELVNSSAIPIQLKNAKTLG